MPNGELLLVFQTMPDKKPRPSPMLPRDVSATRTLIDPRKGGVGCPAISGHLRADGELLCAKHRSTPHAMLRRNVKSGIKHRQR